LITSSYAANASLYCLRNDSIKLLHEKLESYGD
jgi:hypothetical protein